MPARRGRFTALLIWTLAPALSAAASLPTPRSEDSCGNPMLVSDGYEAAWGKVIEVVDPVTVVVECVPGPRPPGYEPPPVHCVRETLELVQLVPPPAGSSLRDCDFQRIEAEARAHWRGTWAPGN